MARHVLVPRAKQREDDESTWRHTVKYTIVIEDIEIYRFACEKEHVQKKLGGR